MKKSERKMLEAKVRALEFQHVQGELMPFSDMKERVLEAHANRVSAGAQEREKKIKARLRLAGRTALTAACLMIGAFVFSALAPVPVSTANSFLRRVQVWVGDILHLSSEMNPPSQPGTQIAGLPAANGSHTTLEDVYAAYGTAVYEPTWLPGDLKLEDIKVTGAEEGFVKIQYRYADQNGSVQFFIEQLPDEMGTGIYPEDAMVHTAPGGTFYIWNADTDWYALALIDGCLVRIKSTLGQDALVRMVDSLRAVN